MYDIHQIQEAQAVFLHLLQHKIVKKNDPAIEPYFLDTNISLVVKKLADTANTQILVGNTNVHLVTKARGSIFATNFTQMKEQLARDKKSDTKLDTKTDLHLVQLVIMVYLSEVDGQATKGSYIDLYGGIRYLELVERVSQVLQHWKKLQESDAEFAKRQKIDLPEMINEWETKRLQPDDASQLHSSNKTKFGVVQTAMKLLEKEKLVKIFDQRITALEALHERLEQLYHSEQRYRLWKNLIDEVERGEISL